MVVSQPALCERGVIYMEDKMSKLYLRAITDMRKTAITAREQNFIDISLGYDEQDYIRRLYRGGNWTDLYAPGEDVRFKWHILWTVTKVKYDSVKDRTCITLQRRR